ncbi:hypothetical protein G3496_18205 [Shewanella baltica]|uniref:hypothetical protein n=2 Tax=Shewanella baltica TaxID=62322 RepID=UPI00217E2677|nr:hypothetical protein [Shewanella baltica]MCS6136851.1 hypothetical protein [Shewanella baltica]
MNDFNTFFAQAYWWLSLFGGAHCLALAIYIRYFYHPDGNQKLLAAFLSLIALYFLTGLLNRDNSPIPIHILFNLINPIYFLLMPLLYLYCKRSLVPTHKPLGFSKHYWPSAFTLVFAILDIALRLSAHPNGEWQPLTQMLKEISISQWGAILPALLSIQTCCYFIALWVLFRRHKRNQSDATLTQEALGTIRFRWLIGLTLAMLLNWLIRVFVVILPFYLGDNLSLLSHALPRLTLLLSMYMLAVYGLKQITRSAYLKGRLAKPQSQPRPIAIENVLTPEEYEFLHQIQQDDTEKPQASSPPKN